MKSSIFFLLFTLFSFNCLFAQDWELEKEFDGISIYTRLLDGEELKELKIEFTLETRLAPIVALLNDVEKYTEWVYNSKEFKSLEVKSTGNGFFYGVVDFPWPLEDRDYVIETSTTQDPETKVVLIESKQCKFSKAPAENEYVRIPYHHNQWLLTPINENEVALRYFLKTDPGGSIPNRLINSVIDLGATETIKNMISELEKAEQDIRLAYIQEK